ncbi:MAG TPA: sensor histidine kinase [Rhodanobacteraceae bacterium]|nr:sensor histidine kinase [Rhodanobacteraceae bacterium]
MTWIDINAALAARAASDSILSRESADAHGQGASRMPWVWLIWLVWLFGPVVFGLSGYFGHWLWPTLASLPLFLVLYVAAYVMSRRYLVGYALATAALGLAVLPFNPYAGTYVIYACALAGEWSQPRRSFMLIAAILALLGAEWLVLHIPWQYLVNFWILCLIVGALGIYGCVQRDRRAELRLTHDEIRRLAASAERERIGRDLHDLLGHTLSLVALKSELAGRLIDRDPGAARREMAEVERVAREALSQVRSAVSGIRAAALAAELASARLLLEAAGVRMDYWVDPKPVPQPVETCLALVLREAVTNVQRHARARSAEVSVIVGAERVIMRVRDDGRGGVLELGNGLTGMRERIRGCGGRLTLESPRGRGTQVEVSLPLGKFGAPAQPASRTVPAGAAPSPSIHAAGSRA